MTNKLVLDLSAGSTGARVVPLTPSEESEYQARLSTPPVRPTVLAYEEFQARFTATEYDAATEFVFGSDVATGKPVRPRLVQAFQRAVAKNAVDLKDAKTAAFLDALVAAGAITSARKTEILTP